MMSDQRTNGRKGAARVRVGHAFQTTARRHQRVTLAELEALPEDVRKNVSAIWRGACALMAETKDMSVEELAEQKEQAAKARRQYRGRGPSEVPDEWLLDAFDALEGRKRVHGGQPMGMGEKYRLIAQQATARITGTIRAAQVAARLRELRRARGDLV